MSDLPWILLGLSSEIGGSKKRNKGNELWAKRYYYRLGYNRFRQGEVERIFDNDKEKFIELLGHEIDWSKYPEYHKDDRRMMIRRDAVKEVAQKEGWWRYADLDELYADPFYRSLAGIESRPWGISIKQYPEKILMPPDELAQFRQEMEEENVKGWIGVACVIVGLFIIGVVMSTLGQKSPITACCISVTPIMILSVIAFRNKAKKTGSYSTGGIVALVLTGFLLIFYWGCVLYAAIANHEII